MLKIKNYFCSICLGLLITFIFSQNALATKLPNDFVDFLKSVDSSYNIRFDGIVEDNKGVVYLPLLPAEKNKVDEIKVIYTYPSNTAFEKKPEVVIFNNNYVLFKLLKNKKGETFIRDNVELPSVVKLGVLPQDMLVPSFFHVSEEYKAILGNLKIPVKQVGYFTTTNNKQTDLLLQQKEFYIASPSSKTLKIVSLKDTSKVYNYILDAVPSFVTEIPDQPYIFIGLQGKKMLIVFDTLSKTLDKEIEFTGIPINVTIKDNLAYVTMQSTNKIAVVDLSKMEISHYIDVLGFPSKIAFDNTHNRIIYHNIADNGIYWFDLSKPLVQAKNALLERKQVVEKYPQNFKFYKGENIVDIVFENNTLYTISRSDNNLKITNVEIIDRPQEKQKIKHVFQSYEYRMRDSDLTPWEKQYKFQIKEKEIPLGEKPVKMLFENDKLFVLNAVNPSITIFNIKTGVVEKNIPLNTTAFFNDMNIINNYLLLTSVEGKNYFLFDMDKECIIKSVPFFINVSSIVVKDK